MIFDLIFGDQPVMTLIVLLLTVPTVLISLSVHECSHGYVAYKLGDPTAHSLGRLTLNPIKHLDPIGAICMLLFGFGWAKPVPVNSRYFKNPKRGMALTALAGPLSNLLLGFIGTVLHVILFRVSMSYGGNNEYAVLILEAAVLFFYYFVYLNIALVVFNLIPVPPFDGSRIFYVFMPDKWYWKVMKYEKIIMIVVLLGFVFGFFGSFVSYITDVAVNGMYKLVTLII